MAKSRGLPPSFQIDVPREALDGPVQLGDYLDEEARRPVIVPQPVQRVAPPPVSQPQPPPRPPTRPQQATPPRMVMPASYEAKVVSMRPQPVQRFIAPEPEEQEESESAEGVLQKHLKSPPRKQVNMNPETLRMVDELLTQIQTYSGQKDAKASEMFHALVSALYESRELLDLSHIQPRGRWGTPMARAFPVSLKNAFQSAIADRHGRNR